MNNLIKKLLKKMHKEIELEKIQSKKSGEIFAKKKNIHLQDQKVFVQRMEKEKIRYKRRKKRDNTTIWNKICFIEHSCLSSFEYNLLT
jgi:hypothetical protein